MFHCSGMVQQNALISESPNNQLKDDADRHIQSTISRSLELNNRHFREQCERLDKWADDKVKSLEKDLYDIKERIKALNRQARLAASTEEQHGIQEQIQKLEREKRRQRQQIFDQEDEIMDKRDALIDPLEKRMKQRCHTETLFTIRWKVI